ncbi:MAG: hypothetical protein GY701_19210 [Sulfitobacter sp.]|nr:hypothetical protein [Sulfitobacter sp.]
MKILISEAKAFTPAALERLSTLGTVELCDPDRHSLLAALQDADVLWVRLRHRIDREVLDAAPNLSVIVSATTGLNHIDVTETTRHGISVISLAGETEFLRGVRATAEHTIALTLALLRRVPGAAREVHDGGWDRDRFRGHEVYGKSVGVIGYGRLGSIVADYFQALGARVVATDPHVTANAATSGVRLLLLDGLLRTADIVTLHATLSAETTGFFDRSCFERMKQGAWLVNTARGELLDETDLLTALETGHLTGAALDVVEDEIGRDRNDDPLFRYARGHDNLLITPHIGGCTFESTAKTELYLAEKLCAALSS